MKPNVEAIQGLVNEMFNGKKSAFASAVGVERAQVSRILRDGTGAGAQFFGGLMAFCEKNRLAFKKYIFLPKDVKKINNPKSKVS